MLKTAMQTQLDGVKTGLIHLKTAQQDISDIKKIVHEIEELFPTIPVLVDKLKYVREESMKHSQYAVSMENLKHIFNVPETVAKTRDLIADGKLLEAHKNLSELENSRDNLLYQLHRLAPTNNADKNMLKHYYGEVEKLSEELGKQLWLLIRLTLNSVRKEPSVIVTALRIIEREERTDQNAARRCEQSGFMSIGRPKNWRKRVFEILEEAVAERIQGNKFHDRSDNKMWLVLHLLYMVGFRNRAVAAFSWGLNSVSRRRWQLVATRQQLHARNALRKLREMEDNEGIRSIEVRDNLRFGEGRDTRAVSD